MRSGLMDSQFITYLAKGLRESRSDGRCVALDYFLGAQQTGEPGGSHAESGERLEPGFGIFALVGCQVEDAPDSDPQQGDLIIKTVGKSGVKVAEFERAETGGIKAVLESIGITWLCTLLASFFFHAFPLY